ncbi:hypothetical protein AGABI2DRAFT_137537, partial [Agaricus bisporus var. bisporus H97]|uniref:hypothetical protein n=1 Tax=Agaricus bisporus var. bisporus (strain H97 / ATCC MYA-4626 / FGSC 10389) TaxID=936046 RepID=UPI00029F6ADB
MRNEYATSGMWFGSTSMSIRLGSVWRRWRPTGSDVDEYQMTLPNYSLLPANEN